MIEADKGLIIKEKPLINNDGRIKGNRIAIRRDIPTLKQKACVLAEELGHYYTNYGDILDQSITENRKQELKARAWAYNKQIGLIGIINAYHSHCHTLYEMADFLEVTEDFLLEALEYYKGKYGTCIEVDNYIVYFEPVIGVFEKYK